MENKDVECMVQEYEFSDRQMGLKYRIYNAQTNQKLTIRFLLMVLAPDCAQFSSLLRKKSKSEPG